METGRALLASLLLLSACPSAAPGPAEPDPEPTATPTPAEGDALLYRAFSEGAPPSIEPLDIELIGDHAWVCGGVEALNVHDLSDPDAPAWVGRTTFAAAHPERPRCVYLDVDGDRVVVTSRRDGIQPQAFVALVDAGEPASPVVLHELATELPLEEAAWLGGRLYVAAHGSGIVVFDVEGDQLVQASVTAGFGNVARLSAVGERIAAGTPGGTLLLLDADLAVLGSLELGAPILAIEALDGGRAAVALGSAGLALVDLEALSELGRVPTHGVAVRLQAMSEGRLLVANWSDLRLYRIDGDQLELLAVDAVFQARERPRVVAAAGRGDLVVAGEWEGLHTLRFQPDTVGAEITPDALWLRLAADGQQQQFELDLRNEGQLELVVSAPDLPGWTIEPAELELPPEQTGRLVVTAPPTLEVVEETLVLESNDPDEPEAPIRLLFGAPTVTVGDPAPDFLYTGVGTGEVHELSAQQGRVVLLSYFGLF